MPPVTRVYDIDLSKPPGERWAPMIKAERERARSMIGNCNKHALSFIEWAGKIGNMGFAAFKSAVAGIYKIGGRAYGEDVDVWAKGIGMPRRDIIFANLQYEICQAFGCTSTAYNLPGGRGVAHVRNMDWPLIGCGPFTCMMNYHGKSGPFTTVGWPSYIGVLSAIAPGRFSATINQAPQPRFPSLSIFKEAWPSSMALRWNFENSASYEDAIKDLLKTRMVGATFFTMVGVKTDEACIIEHTGRSAEVRQMQDGSIAQANHYMCAANTRHNVKMDDELHSFSKERLEAATRFAANAAINASDQPELLNTVPALCEPTCQQMAFIPATGDCKVYYHDTDEYIKNSRQ